MGGRVRLNIPERVAGVFAHSAAEYALSHAGPRVADSEPRAYALLEGEGRVWIVSEPGQSSIPPPRSAVEGRLVELRVPDDLARQAYAVARVPVGMIGAAVWLQPEAPSAEPLRTWVPVAGAGNSIWLVFDGLLDAEPALPLGGVYLGVSDKETPDALLSALGRPGPAHGRYRLIEAISGRDYARRERLVARFLGGFRWSKLPFLAAGLLLLIGAVVLASRE